MTEPVMSEPSEISTNFSYHPLKNHGVNIHRDNRSVAHLKGQGAIRFLKIVEGKRHDLRQLEMAKAAGNFKRGNEKLIATKSKALHQRQRKH